MAPKSHKKKRTIRMINLKQSDIPRGRMNLWKPGKPERARGHARKKRVFKKGIDPVKKGV